MSMRAFCVRLHRYAGLATAGFLLVAGLTGSVLAFHGELDAWLNPDLFRAASRGNPLPVAELIERLERADRRLRVISATLPRGNGESVHVSVQPRIDPATGQAFELGFDELFADPASGEVLGARLWGACCFGRRQLIPFLYVLHYSLQVPGEAGVWIMGVVGLVWAFDSFVGAYLTFPAGRKDRGGASSPEAAERRPWLRRWSIAWRIKPNAGAFRLNLDLHRAGGLWFFGLLVVLAVSGVSFNLRDTVFEPAVSLFSPLTPSPFDEREEHSPDRPVEPRISFADILTRAGAAAAQRGLGEETAGSIFYNPGYGIYGVGFGDGRAAGLGTAYLYFDGADGRPLGAYLPGEGTAGDLFEALQFPLHSGRIAGLAGRIVICLTGLAVAMLSVTGVVIWQRKRRGRRLARARR
jgi:uncharacterized iron-regulated membrane protein